jgi:hypothetical protein
MTAQVVRLLDRHHIACADIAEIADWIIAWGEALKSGDYGDIRSVVMVTENGVGNLGVIAQSVNPMDQARCIGLLAMAAHRKMDGRTDMADMP